MFIVGGTNGRERDRSQVFDGKVEKTPRARLLLGCVLKMIDQKSVLLVGCPALPFIDQGGVGVIDGRKRNSVLDRSGCRMLVLVSAFEG